MRLRLSSRIKQGKTIQRVSFELNESELTYLGGTAPSDHPRITVHCEHGLVRVGKPTASDNGYSMWLVKGRKERLWCAQLNVRLFPDINWNEYQEITEVVARRVSKELHTMLAQLAPGEQLKEPQIRQRAPRSTPAVPAPVVAESAPAEPSVSALLPKEFQQAVSVEPTLAADVADRYKITDTDRTMLRTAVDILNGQSKRGGIRMRVDEQGELRVDIVKVKVELENL